MRRVTAPRNARTSQQVALAIDLFGARLRYRLEGAVDLGDLLNVLVVAEQQGRIARDVVQGLQTRPADVFTHLVSLVANRQPC
jgi:hypothetical protein